MNGLVNFLSFKKTWIYNKFIHCPNKMLALFTGNQYGKTGGTAHSYVARIMSVHPVPKKNVVYFECENRQKLARKELKREEFYASHESKDSATWTAATRPEKCPECGSDVVEHVRQSRVFRFASESLPGQSAQKGEESTEVKNTQYPAFKKWLPPELLINDITHRSPTIVLRDVFGGPNIVIEFVSYNQSTQATAGVQRLSVWYDEQPDYHFRKEQQPRLLQEDGDEILTLTPADYITWCYDEIFEKAGIYYRSKRVSEYLKSQNQPHEREYITGNPASIAVFQAATDDNPTLDGEVIDAMFMEEDDPDILAIRRYGIFKQVSGRIFKDFEFATHSIDGEKYFPEGIPAGWTHAQGIDYHPQTPWAWGVMSLSPTNEAFIWLEHNPSPERLTTLEIAEQLNEKLDIQPAISLMDPLSEATKKDKITIKQDMNRIYHELKMDGRGPGAYWQSWDTKGEKGRDAIRERLKNAKKCGKPFNNDVVKDGAVIHIPTIWIFNTCRNSLQSMRQWRWEEYVDKKSLQTKGQKNTPEQKFSHFNMVWEAIFKEPGFRPKRHYHTHQSRYRRFHGDSRAARA